MRCDLRELNPLTLPKEERNRISQLHTSKVDTDTRSGADAERMEGCFSGRGLRFSCVAFFRDPALGIETVKMRRDYSDGQRIHLR